MSENKDVGSAEKVATWQFLTTLVAVVAVVAAVGGWAIGTDRSTTAGSGAGVLIYNEEALMSRIMEVEGDAITLSAQMRALDKAEEIATQFSEGTGMVVLAAGAVIAHPGGFDITERLTDAVMEDLYGQE